ncbi:TIGR00266 family protein [Halomicrococcus sp. SG-WS-1]|uniref:TIGR00266 family protein n=1 Tax=Halomicrococcus sp. SG-WS-1 TaxID=3439057 RepID=UPI003F78BF92
MDYERHHRPSFTELELTLDEGDEVRTEAGSMVSHSDGVTVETRAEGGLLSSLKRSVLGGESFFVNTFEAERPGTLTLAPALPGDIVQYELRDESLFVQSSSFLAAETGVDLDTKFGGSRSFFGGEGLFLLELSGRGLTFLSSYGAISVVSLDPGERHVVDTGHVVAFEDTVDFSVERVGGLKSTLFSGEGLVCEFEGPGNIWTQSRSPDAFLAWLIPNLPSNGAGNGSA